MTDCSNLVRNVRVERTVCFQPFESLNGIGQTALSEHEMNG